VNLLARIDSTGERFYDGMGAGALFFIAKIGVYGNAGHGQLILNLIQLRR
jgi:hypothetical protein